MADERTKPLWSELSFVPQDPDQGSLQRLDDAASLEAPEVIAAEIIEDLQTALDEMSLIYTDLASKAG